MPCDLNFDSISVITTCTGINTVSGMVSTDYLCIYDNGYYGYDFNLEVRDTNNLGITGSQIASDGTFSFNIPSAYPKFILYWKMSENCIIQQEFTIPEVVDAVVTANGATLTVNVTNGIFQWIDCDNLNALIPNETNPTFSPVENGNYAVITTNNGCVDTSNCVNFLITEASGFNTSDAIKVYPNPAIDHITIKINSNSLRSDFRITDVAGRFVMKGELSSENSIINISELKMGIYYIKIGNQNKTCKLIK
jgi:hypothetical protein